MGFTQRDMMEAKLARLQKEARETRTRMKSAWSDAIGEYMLCDEMSPFVAAADAMETNLKDAVRFLRHGKKLMNEIETLKDQLGIE